MSEPPDILRDGAAVEGRLPELYDELRRLAQHLVTAERPGNSIDATGLVHEAYLRLVDMEHAQWESPRHFFNAAALAMRRILIDRARQRGRLKRGGNRAHQPLDETVIPAEREFGLENVEAATLAIEELERQNARWAEVVRLRIFAGLTVPQTAELMEISERTVKEDWAFARAWIRSRIRGETP